jgi:hypothetical protein
MPTILNPTPTQGTGTPFGSVPGALGLPDPFGDLSKVAPGLGALNKNLLGNLTSESLGIISPGTRNALQLTNAQTGVGSGMPFSGLSTNQLFGNIAGFSEGLQKQAADQYSSLIPTISKTQTVSPELQTEIANRNSINAAAPSPTAAANYAKQLFDEYAAKVRGPGGGISFGPQPSTPRPLDFGNPAGGTAPPDTRGLTFGGQTYYGGATPGGGGGGGITSLAGDVGAGGVPINTGSNPVTGTSNFDPFGGFGSFFAGPTGQDYGASEAATEKPGPGQSGYVYMGANPAAGGAPTDLSSLGIDDALAQVFGL